MDNILISHKQHLFAYCIADGALDDMSEERRAALILTITEIKESLLSGGDASACSKKKIIIFFETVRPNNSLVELTARTNRFK